VLNKGACVVPTKTFSDVHFDTCRRVEQLIPEVVIPFRGQVRIDEPIDLQLEGPCGPIGIEFFQGLGTHAAECRKGRAVLLLLVS
jgi:hypothetical protein